MGKTTFTSTGDRRISAINSTKVISNDFLIFFWGNPIIGDEDDDDDDDALLLILINWFDTTKKEL